MAEYFTVQNSQYKKEYEGRFGTMYVYSLDLLDGEGMPVEGVELSQKETTPEPHEGQKLCGTIEETQYGMKFHKVAQQEFDRQPAPQAAPARRGPTSPPPARQAPQPQGRNDEATRAEIIRQSSLKAAIEYCIAKAGLMKPDDAVKYLEGEKIVNVAIYFAKYCKTGMVPKDEEPEPAPEADFESLLEQEGR